MPLAAEQAAPAWLPVLFLLIPVAIMAGVGGTALRRRGRAGAAGRAQARRRPAASTEVGSAADVADPSGYSAPALLKALAVRPEDEERYSEGWAGAMLGLKAKTSSSVSVLEPNVFWGTRERGQVFVRLGPDERIEGATTMLSNRHVRAITVLRADAPGFALASVGGRLVAAAESPPDVAALVAGLAADEVTWGTTHVFGGGEGIVAWRGMLDGVEDSWVYDLWLCERIARALDLPALPPARIGPAWKVPYGLGRDFSPRD
jgi:hypothetical protein